MHLYEIPSDLFHVVDEKRGHAGGVEEQHGDDVDQRVALDRTLLRPRVHSQVADRHPEIVNWNWIWNIESKSLNANALIKIINCIN